MATNLSAVVSLAGAMRNTRAANLPLARDQINEMVKATLTGSEDLIGTAVTWEPNALDGKDAEYAGKGPLYDATGRFMPYWTRGADWCVACKEMERMTFSDGRVATAMRGMRLIQVDVTAHNADDRALMKRFQLFGPPGIILFDASGKEVPQARVIGFMPPDSFIRQLQRVAG